MFLDSEFLVTELQVLAYFTHTITSPFLYFIEVNSNEELLTMFPRLFTDSKAGGLETLIDYRVEYLHVKASELAGDLPKKLSTKLSTKAIRRSTLSKKIMRKKAKKVYSLTMIRLMFKILSISSSHRIGF